MAAGGGEESVHYLSSSSSFGLRGRRGGGVSILPLAIADRCACAAADADAAAAAAAVAGKERRGTGHRKRPHLRCVKLRFTFK